MAGIPRWAERARTYRATSGRVRHHDGTCDAVYPGTSDDRNGRCLLAEAHPGMHVYRGRGPVKELTKQQMYQAERTERKRVARRHARRARTSSPF